MATRSDERVSIREVAASAGVAISSVSRVLAGHPDVSEDMRARVQRAVRESGYEPNTAAKTLRSGKSMSVGFVIGDITNPLMSAIALAAETRLAEDNYTLLLANSRGTAEQDVENVRLFRQRRVDGLLLSITDESNKTLRRELTRFDKPVVLLDRRLERLPNVSSVFFDHAAGFSAATEHLLSLGHRRIGLIAGSDHVRTTRERLAAVERAVGSVKQATVMVRRGTLSREQGRTAVESLLAERTRPTAIICAGNQLLAGALSALRAHGVQVPRDMSLVTTDDTELAEFHQPPIATVSRDARSLGHVAAEILLSRMAGEPPAPPAILPTAFAATDSCGQV